MGRNITALRQDVRQILQDEFSDVEDMVWKDDELEHYIMDMLTVLSGIQPYQKRVTVASDGTKEVDLSSLDDYADLISVSKAEYETGQDPPAFRNVSRFGDTLTIAIGSAPTSGEDIYLYCNLVHTLNETTSTLNKIQESLIIKGACGQAAISKSRYYIDKVNEGGNSVPDRLYNWGRGRMDEYKEGLKKLFRVRQYTQYPTD